MRVAQKAGDVYTRKATENKQVLEKSISRPNNHQDCHPASRIRPAFIREGRLSLHCDISNG